MSISGRSIVVVAACLGLPFACVEDGDPDDDGRFGQGGASSSAQQSGAGASSSTSGAGGDPSASSADASSSSSGAPCNDTGVEPNDTEATAVDLGAIDDCDSNGGQDSGVITTGDEDWFKFRGSDALCISNVAASVQASGSSRVCAYIEGITDCMNLTFTCPNGSTADTSPGGRDGCCSSTGLDFGISCNTVLPTSVVDVYIRVDAPPNETCLSYTLDYHF